MSAARIALCVNYITITHNCITYTNPKQLTFMVQKLFCQNHDEDEQRTTERGMENPES